MLMLGKKPDPLQKVGSVLGEIWLVSRATPDGAYLASPSLPPPFPPGL